MNVFHALADPTRRQIIEQLALGETSFGEIADRFEMSRPAVSQHLKVLRDSGIVVARADGQRRIYRLDPEGFGEVDAWLAGVRSYWNPRLDELARQLGKREDERTGE